MTRLKEQKNKQREGYSIRETRKKAVDSNFRFSATEVEKVLAEKNNGNKEHGLSLSDEKIRKILNRQFEDLIESIEEENPLRSLLLEHRDFLRLLSSSKAMIANQNADYKLFEELFQTLSRVPEHFAIEEKIFFPRLIESSANDLTDIMIVDHNGLKVRLDTTINELREIARSKRSLDYKELGSSLDYILTDLREHLYKENTLLYPKLAEIISHPIEWEQIEAEWSELTQKPCG